MWVNENGFLRQTADTTRVKFRTSMSAQMLDELKQLADQHDTFINYLLEDGMTALLEQNFITFNKETRPKDRVQYKTTYDEELLEQIRAFAKAHNLFINDVIEYSVQFIDVGRVKDREHRYRIE